MPEDSSSNPLAGSIYFSWRRFSVFESFQKLVVPPALAVHYNLGSVLLGVVLRWMDCNLNISPDNYMSMIYFNGEMLIKFFPHKYVSIRVVGRSENTGVPVVLWWHNLPLLVEIGLTDLPKSGGAMAPQAPQGTTPLLFPSVKKEMYC